jgi:hypothetical protein
MAVSAVVASNNRRRFVMTINIPKKCPVESRGDQYNDALGWIVATFEGAGVFISNQKELCFVLVQGAFRRLLRMEAIVSNRIAEFTSSNEVPGAPLVRQSTVPLIRRRWCNRFSSSPHRQFVTIGRGDAGSEVPWRRGARYPAPRSNSVLLRVLPAAA